MFETIWNFFLNNWAIILSVALLLLVTGRIVINNPKYSLKEIAKRPWLIFKLFAQSAGATIDIIEDIIDIANEVDKVAGGDNRIGEAIDKLKKIEEGKEIVKKVHDTSKGIDKNKDE